MVVLGTRPEAIKLAPVIQQLSVDDRFHLFVTVTAQHRQMLDQVLELFKIEPDFDLGVFRDRQSLTSLTARIMTGLDPILSRYNPDVAIVQGDTTTAFAGALAAFYHHIPVAHVEAGLRSGNPDAPYPEETNRRLASQIATLHLAPTPRAAAALELEGIRPESVICTGNTVIDALHWVVERNADFGNIALKDIDQDPRRVLLVTLHRRETWGDRMTDVARALARIAHAHPDVLMVIPIHKNPLVREAVIPHLIGITNILVVEPLPYGDFARLMHRAHLIITDSGGIQEEAPSLGKPVLVLRDVTERPEGVQAGVVELVGTNEETIFHRTTLLLNNRPIYDRMARTMNCYGDGCASGRIVSAISWYFGDGEKPEEWRPTLDSCGVDRRQDDLPQV